MDQAEFTVRTQGAGLYEVTSELRQWVRGQSTAQGLLTLFVRHTSCSLLIQENADPDVRTDLQGFLTRLVPRGDHPDMAWLTHVLEGPDDMPAHIRAALLPVSLSIPVAGHAPVLGTWQGIYLFEHRDAPHTRRIAAHLA